MLPVETEVIALLDEIPELETGISSGVDYTELLQQILNNLELLNANFTIFAEHLYSAVIYILVVLIIWGSVKFIDGFIKL